MSTETLTEQLEAQRRKVAFDTYDIIVQQLVTMVETSAIDVAPVYQRQFRWDTTKRSHLIESVFLGVPVPSLFMAANRDGTWELVDGVQRLSTLVQFVGPPAVRAKLGLEDSLALEGLKKLDRFNGKRFADLPSSLQLQFHHRPIKVITLSDKSDMIVRFDLFERLNTGGVALTNQEIRACIYRGSFADFLDRMAKNEDFKSVVRLTPAQEKDGTREECVLRFFAFLHGYKSFVHSVVDFLNDYMAEATKAFSYREGEALFVRTFSELARVLPRGIARGSRRVTPINLYEGVAVGAALAVQAKSRLVAPSSSKWLQSAELRRYTTGATNNRPMVVGRIEYCRDRLLGR
ncbi:hypothetical protein PLCT1_02276 [Planctomycetaceae bacterium]|nr:hypothetical protein PLCT1_02276 [Planctomycetaceae bacterium]